MANRLLFMLLFYAFQFEYSPAFAANKPVPSESITLQINECEASAPENFQVTSIASDLVSLGWTPAWVGATHTLEISVEEFGNWVIIFTTPSVPGNSYTFNNLSPGYYRARIATNCASGETSSILSEVLFKFKIIDLSTAGRIPKNSVEVEDCKNIEYLDHEWVGFRVTEISTGISNLFEFIFSEGQGPTIKRVIYDHPIAAVNENGIFPTDLEPILKTSVPFQVDDFNNWDPNNLVNIGYVTCLNNNTLPPTITLCKDEDNSILAWKPEYRFTALTAESVITDPYPNNGSTEKHSRDTIEYGRFKAQTPFKESLNIFIPRLLPGCSKAAIHLLNTNGLDVLAYNFDLNATRISIPTASLLPGFYILQFETDRETQILKIVKSE